VVSCWLAETKLAKWNWRAKVGLPTEAPSAPPLHTGAKGAKVGGR